MPAWRYDGAQWVEFTVRKRKLLGGWFTTRGWRWDGAVWVPIWPAGGAEIPVEPLVLVFNLDEATSATPSLAFNLAKDPQT